MEIKTVSIQLPRYEMETGDIYAMIFRFASWKLARCFFDVNTIERRLKQCLFDISLRVCKIKPVFCSIIPL